MPPPPLEDQADEGGVPPPPSEAGAPFVAGGAGDIFSQQGATSGSWSAAEDVPESADARLDSLNQRIEQQRAAAQEAG